MKRNLAKRSEGGKKNWRNAEKLAQPKKNHQNMAPAPTIKARKQVSWRAFSLFFLFLNHRTSTPQRRRIDAPVPTTDTAGALHSPSPSGRSAGTGSATTTSTPAAGRLRSRHSLHAHSQTDQPRVSRLGKNESSTLVLRRDGRG
jgi:hypothetical protein